METRLHTDAVIAKLKAIPMTVGDAIGKVNASASAAKLTLPHAVVYPGPGEVYGTLDAPEADAEMTWRVVYVGAGRDAAELIRDKGRAALLTGFAVDGRVIVRVTVDVVGSVERDDTVNPAVFYCSESYRAFSTPS